MHQAQLSRQGHGALRARYMRRLCRAQWPAWPGCGRPSEGHPVRRLSLYRPGRIKHPSYRPQVRGNAFHRRGGGAAGECRAADLWWRWPHQFGPGRLQALLRFRAGNRLPVYPDAMGLGALPGSDPQFVGMLGMHGTYEANMAMHQCDVMVCVGARFDDRITGRVDAFSPTRKNSHRYRSVVHQ